MNMNQVTFGKYLKKHRMAKHMTQRELAEKIGVQTKSISYIERGLNFPSTDKLFKMCMLLDMSLDEYMYDKVLFTSEISSKEINELLSKIPQKYYPMLLQIIKVCAEEIIKTNT